MLQYNRLPSMLLITGALLGTGCVESSDRDDDAAVLPRIAQDSPLAQFEANLEQTALERTDAPTLTTTNVLADDFAPIAGAYAYNPIVAQGSCNFPSPDQFFITDASSDGFTFVTDATDLGFPEDFVQACDFVASNDDGGIFTCEAFDFGADFSEFGLDAEINITTIAAGIWFSDDSPLIKQLPSITCDGPDCATAIATILGEDFGTPPCEQLIIVAGTLLEADD